MRPSIELRAFRGMPGQLDGSGDINDGIDDGAGFEVNARHMLRFRLFPRRASPASPLDHGRRRRSGIVGVTLLASLALLCTGLWMPAITVKTLFFNSEYSMIEGIVSFLQAEEYFLFLVVALFSVILPAVKLAVLVVVWARGEAAGRGAQKALHFIAAISKWSMLDVFIVAVMVVALDGNLFTTAEVHSGIVLFALAIILSTWAALRLHAWLASAAAPPVVEAVGMLPTPARMAPGNIASARDIIGDNG